MEDPRDRTASQWKTFTHNGNCALRSPANQLHVREIRAAHDGIVGIAESTMLIAQAFVESRSTLVIATDIVQERSYRLVQK